MEGKRSVSATPAHKNPASVMGGSPGSENTVPTAQTTAQRDSTTDWMEKDILQGLEGVTTIEEDLEDDDYSPSNSPFAPAIRSDYHINYICSVVFDCYNLYFLMKSSCPIHNIDFSHRPVLSGRPTAAATTVSPSVALSNAAQMLSSQDHDDLAQVRFIHHTIKSPVAIHFNDIG